MLTREHVNPGLRIPEATQIIESFSTPADIDKLVNFLRNRHYPAILRGRTPLLVADRTFEGLMASANRRYLLNPTILASAFWNNFLEEHGYFGSTANLQGELTERDIDKDGDRVGLPRSFIADGNLIAFNVSGDLIGRDGRIDGRASRRYVLYLSSSKFYEALARQRTGVPLRKSVRDLLDQAESLYSRDALLTEPILWLHSDIWQFQQTEASIRENRTRFQKAISNAKTIEGYAATHPVAGGLPGLGKNSR